MKKVKMSVKILIQLLVTIMFIAGILFYFHSKNLAKQNHFKENGILTEATVTKLQSRYKSRRRLSGRLRLLRNYDIEVSYFTKENQPDTSSSKKIIERDEDGVLRMNFGKPPKMGELVITTIRAKKNYYSEIKEGDKIEILYLPDDIEKAMLKREVE
ncbi:MAG: hypothetical protein ACLFNU_01250 [Bacteroidales bacterium]